MLVLHVYILGKSGAIERAYDFMRSDGKEAFDGVDIVIPYDEKKNSYPITEGNAMALIAHKSFGEDH